MSNVISIKSAKRRRSYTRLSGGKVRLPHEATYEVWLKADLRSADRRLEELFYGHMAQLLCCLGGVRLKEGFTKEAVRRGDWLCLQHWVKPSLLRTFLDDVDGYLAIGLLELEIEGVTIGKSPSAA